MTEIEIDSKDHNFLLEAHEASTPCSRRRFCLSDVVVWQSITYEEAKPSRASMFEM